MISAHDLFYILMKGIFRAPCMDGSFLELYNPQEWLKNPKVPPQSPNFPKISKEPPESLKNSLKPRCLFQNPKHPLLSLFSNHGESLKNMIPL